MQKTEEFIYKFWHALAALCVLSEITTTLVLDMFNSHMNIEEIQEKLRTELKESQETLEVAIAFKGIKRQKPMEH